MRILIGIAAVAAFCATTSVASSATINIMTASKGGNYNTVICPAIVDHIAKAGISGKCIPSAGSGENFNVVYNSGGDTVGLTQMDAFGLKTAGSGIEDPDEREMFVEDAEEAMGSLGFIVGESLFCAAKKGGRVPEQASWAILNDDEPMSDPFVISTYEEGSGPSLTLGFLQDSFPSFGRNTEIMYKENMKFEVELNRLRAGKRDMVCWVTMANPEDSRLVAVVESDDLFLVPFDSPELANVKIGTVPAYSVFDVAVSGSIWDLFGAGETVTTITTGVSVAINVDELDGDTYNALVAAVNDEDLIPADGFVGTLLKYQRKAMGTLMDAYKGVEKAVGG